MFVPTWLVWMVGLAVATPVFLFFGSLFVFALAVGHETLRNDERRAMEAWWSAIEKPDDGAHGVTGEKRSSAPNRGLSKS
jgi:hypothetical protein